jgi:hypothetical protein
METQLWCQVSVKSGFKFYLMSIVILKPLAQTESIQELTFFLGQFIRQKGLPSA